MLLVQRTGRPEQDSTSLRTIPSKNPSSAITVKISSKVRPRVGSHFGLNRQCPGHQLEGPLGRRVPGGRGWGGLYCIGETDTDTGGGGGGIITWKEGI